MSTTPTPVKTPVWFWPAAGLGLVWNAYGVVQFIKSVTASRDSLMSMGMSAAQADTMSGYPLWMTVAFAVGVFGGLLGCALLLLRNRFAVPVFAASLIGYIALYIGDITEGVFAAMGMEQVVILTFVVVVAAALLWLSRHSVRHGVIA
jgi:uncharacterized membrane protein